MTPSTNAPIFRYFIQRTSSGAFHQVHGTCFSLAPASACQVHGTCLSLLQTGVFNSVVNGNSHSGGLMNFVLRQKKAYPWSPGFLQMSVVTEDGTPTSPPSMFDLYQPEDRSAFDWGFLHQSAFDTLQGHWNHEAGLGVFISPR